MKRGLWLLVLVVASARAQPDGGPGPAAPAAPAAASPLAASIAAALEPELAKLELHGGLVSYQKITMDATLATVSRLVRPGKHDCDDVPAPSFCPKQLFHAPLGQASGWFAGGQLYRLERNVSLPSWDSAHRAAYQAAFDALVLARLPGGKIEHDDGVYWQSHVYYDVAGQRPLAISMVMAPGGLTTARIDLSGKSSARADKLADLEEKQQQAAAARRDRASNLESCKCRLATIGSRWPVRSGHAAPHPDDGRWRVVSVDPKHCQAVVEDTMMGGQDTWSCSQFVLPRSNPAGARDARQPALACGDILGE